MAYSEKLKDLIGYYSTILGNGYFAYSTDWPKNMEKCRWLEQKNLTFEGKAFRLEDYLTKVLIYNDKHEPTSEYQTIVDVNLPLVVAAQNMKNPHVHLTLPNNIASGLIKLCLSKLAGLEIQNELIVFSKKIVDHNQTLQDFMRKYETETKSITVPCRVASNGIYKISVSRGNLFGEEKSLIPEEVVIKDNIVGFMSALADLMLKNMPAMTKGSKDIN